MTASINVYGPQGCGKTRNGHALRKHFGLDRVYEWDNTQKPPPHTGALVLTNDCTAAKRAEDHGMRSVEYSAAIKLAGIRS